MESYEQAMLRMGFDATQVNAGTLAMMDKQKKASVDYVGFWEGAMAKKDAATAASAAKQAEIEQASLDASFARYKANVTNKENLDRQWMENKAAMADIAAGSGGYGSMPGGGAGRGGGPRAGGMAGAQVAADLVGGSGWKTAAEGGMFTIGIIHLQHAIEQIMEGRVPTALARIPRAIIHVGKFLTEFAEVLGVAVGAVGATWEVVKLTRAVVAAGQARQQEVFSGADLARQAGKLGGKVASKIDELEDSGRISKAKAEILLRMAESGNDYQIRIAARAVLAEEVKLANEKSDAEKRAAEAADYAQRAAEGKAIHEKEAADAIKKQAELNKENGKLQKETLNIEHQINMVERVTPTLEDLAGRNFTESLNKQYGKGGRYDLASGDGPFAGVAQDYELAQKQQMWDIIHGNAQFDSKGNLIGGEAMNDRQRMISDKNMLGAAGLETDAMKFTDMREHLDSIRTDMAKLGAAIDNNAINARLQDDK